MTDLEAVIAHLSAILCSRDLEAARAEARAAIAKARRMEFAARSKD